MRMLKNHMMIATLLNYNNNIATAEVTQRDCNQKQKSMNIRIIANNEGIEMIS